MNSLIVLPNCGSSSVLSCDSKWFTKASAVINPRPEGSILRTSLQFFCGVHVPCFWPSILRTCALQESAIKSRIILNSSRTLQHMLTRYKVDSHLHIFKAFRVEHFSKLLEFTSLYGPRAIEVKLLKYLPLLRSGLRASR